MEVKCNMIEAHIFREAGEGIEFLLLKRSDTVIYPGLWQMVNGKIKEGEKAFQTALREIKEETGLIPEKLWVVPNVNHFYSHEYDFISVLPVFAAKVNSDAEIHISREHTEYCWCSAGEALTKLAWAGQRNSVKLIEDYYLNQRRFLDLILISDGY